MTGPWNSTQWQPGNAHRYNGKELNSDLNLNWYDYAARWYDPVIGRFGQVDPLAEDFAAWSTYHYTYNNPIRFIDPDGRATETCPICGIIGDIVSAAADAAAANGNGFKAGLLDVGAGLFKALDSPVNQAIETIENVSQAGTLTEAVQTADPTGLTSLPGTIAAAADGDSRAQGQLVGGVVVAVVIGGRGLKAKAGVRNPVPNKMARVVPGDVSPNMLGAPGAADVFVTAASDIKGLNASQVAKKLTIPESSSGYKVIEFSTPRTGVASPINRSNPGFVGKGRTMGGAREFVIPNQPIPVDSKMFTIY